MELRSEVLMLSPAQQEGVVGRGEKCFAKASGRQAHSRQDPEQHRQPSLKDPSAFSEGGGPFWLKRSAPGAALRAALFFVSHWC